MNLLLQAWSPSKTIVSWTFNTDSDWELTNFEVVFSIFKQLKLLNYSLCFEPKFAFV